MSRTQVYGERDLAYFKTTERERFGLSAPVADYYSLNRGENVDPLYAEPRAWAFEKFSLQVAIEYQEMENRTPEIRDEGQNAEYDAMAYIARLEWEHNAPPTRIPKEGDVIVVQDEFWDVVKGNRGGNVVDTKEAVGFRLDLRKRTKFDPQRKTR